MFWSFLADPTAGNTNYLSPETPMLLPDGAVLGNAGKKFQILEDLDNQVYIFGQYDMRLSLKVKSLVTKRIAGIWNIAGDQDSISDPIPKCWEAVPLDRGMSSPIATRSACRVQRYHRKDYRDSQYLLPEVLPPSTTTRILDKALVVVGNPSQAVIGINYAQSSGGSQKTNF